jgi:hypothetical protein
MLFIAVAATATAAAVTTYALVRATRRTAVASDVWRRTKHVVTTPPPFSRTEKSDSCWFLDFPSKVAVHVVLQDCVDNPAAFERHIENIAAADSLRRLHVWGVDPNSPLHQGALRRVIEALGKNRGLHCLTMRFGDVRSDPPSWRKKVYLLNHALWRLLWEAVAIHPTLRVVDIDESPTYYAAAYEREFRDACIVRALATNDVLADIVHTRYDHDVLTVHTRILPALELNRFRNAIEHGHESRVRLCLAALALAHSRARQSAAIRRFVALSYCTEYHEMKMRMREVAPDVRFLESE